MKNTAVKDALQVLREQGVKIPRKLLSQAFKDQPPVRHADIRKFRAYCEKAWKEKTRFVVGWGGAVGSKKHLTFHTAKGLEGRQKHASTIREKVHQKAAPRPKTGTRAVDVRQTALPLPVN